MDARGTSNDYSRTDGGPRELQTIVGIDEAGYSPLLGPLVVSAAGFEARAIPTDWWVALRAPRAGDRPGPASSPAVDDSKKLYTPARGVGRLELAVLAFLKTIGQTPATLRGLLACVGAEADAEAYPWYREADVVIPVAADREEIDRAAASLSRSFEESGVRFTRFRSVPLLVGNYNRKVQRRGNKSLVLFHSALGLVDRFLHSEEDVCVLADKQGARTYYGDLLSQYFFGCRLEQNAEAKELSTYRILHEGRRFGISFCLKGDAVHLPIALASMCSKYIRELFMIIFNRYWRSINPDLRPTSGYQLDGRRYIRCISSLPEFEQVSRDLIIRKK